GLAPQGPYALGSGWFTDTVPSAGTYYYKIYEFVSGVVGPMIEVSADTESPFTVALPSNFYPASPSLESTVSISGTYELPLFNDEGVITSVTVAPPHDFTSLALGTDYNVQTNTTSSKLDITIATPGPYIVQVVRSFGSAVQVSE